MRITKIPSETPKESTGYLHNKEKDDFLCYIVAELKDVEKMIRFAVLLLVVSFAVELLQILLLLLK